MKSLNYEEIKKIFNQKIFENTKKELLEKISKYPHRYIGLFRPTKPKIKLIQNITQSNEIKFGDAFEILIQKIFTYYQYRPQKKKIVSNENYKDLDQLFEKDNKIIFIEQKIRDDHDSSKKEGQIRNFEDKISLLIQKYNENSIKAYFYFIDPQFQKNKNFYLKEIENLKKAYEIEIYLVYGKELFELEKIENGWNDILEFLKKWKAELPDFPDLNFDKEPNETFKEIKDLKPSVFRKLFENQEIIKEIFPIIFPNKETLKLLQDYFKKQDKKIYQNLSKNIKEILCMY